MEKNNEIKYNVNVDNIKYCTITVIHNQLSMWKKIFKLFDANYEHCISLSDSIVIEIENELFDLDNLNKSECSFVNIECNYYSFGIQPFFPKSIDDKNISSFYLSLIEPEYNNEKNKYYSKHLNKLFDKYFENKNMIDASLYNCVYYNIHTENIVFGICKIKYTGETTSKYVIAYDNSITKQKVIIIIKKIISKLRE